MNQFFQELLKQRTSMLIVAGFLLLLLGITGGLQTETVSVSVETAYRIVSLIAGTLLMLTSMILAWKDSSEARSIESTKGKAKDSDTGEAALATTRPGCDITVLASERSHLSQYYLEQAGSAAAIDIIALTLQTALENFGEDKFIQWIQAGKNIRILMLSPASTAAKTRSREESSNEDFLPSKITEQVKALKRLHSRVERELKSQDYRGSLEVRLYDDLPYFSYFHTDKVMVMGLYYVHIRGLQSEALLIDAKSSIHAKMNDHFNALWIRSGKRGAQKMILCSIAKGRVQFNHALLEGHQPPTQ